MGEFQKRTIEIANTFKNKIPKEYLFVDLIEEVGELATALMYTEGAKTGKMTGKISKEDIADSLADILYDMYKIADVYDIDLDKEYEEMLNKLKKRIESGEFN